MCQLYRLRLMYSTFVVSCIFFVCSWSGVNAICGFEACPKWDPHMINVHVIAHTHDDVGWIKTVDQYFYGARRDLQGCGGVQYILDGIIGHLQQNPERRFTYVEMAYLYRWWNQQNDDIKAQFKSLVDNGQLDFTVGGWSMADEATTHYVSLIDQHTLGFRFLSETFGKCGVPLIAWQIDPFGHSREVANLFSQFGYNALIVGRIDYQDKKVRQASKRTEFVWSGSDDFGGAEFGVKTDRRSGSSRSRHHLQFEHEMQQEQPQATSGDHDMFTGVTYDGYWAPTNFCYDMECSPTSDPIIDDPRLPDYNVDIRVSQFLDLVKQYAATYSSNNVLIPMGSDFMWESAFPWFTNLDKIIKYVNLRSNQTGVRAFYSTPTCYAYAVHQANLTYEVKKDDFFPYARDPHGYWSGYFTSRPALKGFVREIESFYQSFRHLHFFSKLGNTNNANTSIFILGEALGLAQHHDAVSGTERQLVALDYAQRLQAGLDTCVNNVVQGAYGKLMPVSNVYTAPLQQFCAYLNVSSCDVSSSKQAFTVTVYNSYAQANTVWLRIPVGGAVTVTSPTGQVVGSQLVSISNSTVNIWRYMTSGHVPVSAVNTEVVFEAVLPPLGWSTYFVWPSSAQKTDGSESESESESDSESKQESETETESESESESESEEKLFGLPIDEVPEAIRAKVASFGRQNWATHKRSKVARTSANTGASASASAIGSASGSSTFEELRASGVKDFIVKNSHLVLHFDTQTGLLKEVDNLDIGATFELGASLKYYIGADSSGINVPSGAYVFRPMTDTVMNFSNPSVSYVQGPIVQEVRQTFGSWASVVTRLYNDANYMELEWTVGPIDVSDKLGREVVMVYETGLDNNGTCWTDANGRQLVKRVLNYRSTWNLTDVENVSGNYYPINSRILLRDSKGQYQLTVLTDRSEGGGCIREGSAEVMLHRRLLHDDNMGVAEPLNEPGLDGNGLIVRGKHFVLFDTVARSAALHRDLAMRVFARPLVTLASNKLDYNTYAARYRTQWSGLASALPPNVHVLTLADWLNETSAVRQALVRFEHIYQKNEDGNLSQAVTFNLQGVFTNVTITSYETLTLGANLKASDLQRLKWNVQTSSDEEKASEDQNVGIDFGFGLGSKHSRPLKYQSKSEKAKDDWTITLQPMEIRTLVLNLA